MSLRALDCGMMLRVPGGNIRPEAIPMKKLVLLSFAMVVFAGETGIRPRPAAADYPAHQSGAGVTLGAVVVPADQVKKLFAVDLNKLGYVVVEMAVYPDANIEIAARDFLLRIGSDGSTVRPATAATMAGRLHTKASPPPQLPSRVQVHGSETVGYESGDLRRPQGRRRLYGVDRRGGNWRATDACACAEIGKEGHGRVECAGRSREPGVAGGSLQPTGRWLPVLPGDAEKEFPRNNVVRPERAGSFAVSSREVATDGSSAGTGELNSPPLPA